MSSVTLYCLNYGDPASRAFSITVQNSATVDELKGLIKARRYNDLADLETAAMALWQVNIPANRIATLLPGFDLRSHGTELVPFVEIQSVFPNPERNCLHIIIELELAFQGTRPRARFPPQPNHSRTLSDVTGVLIGRMGTGKTTLINKICGLNHPAGAGVSYTDRLYSNRVSVGDYPFTLIDTPGAASTDENYKHSLLQFHALTATPINAILMMVKYDCRHSYVREHLDDLLKLVPEYVKKVVVVISHWDHVTDQDREFEELWESVKGTKCANMVVYSNRHRPEEVANTIYSCVSQLPAEQLEIDQSSFLVRFDIFSQVGELADAYTAFETEAKGLHLEYKQLLLDNEKSDNQQIRTCLDEVIHTLIVQHRQHLETIEEKFHLQYGNNMVELNHYAFYIQMHKLCLSLSTNFANWATGFMSYSLNDAQDPRNLVKECPGCHEIWFKAEGCDGETWCGCREFNIFADILSKVWYRFKVSLVNGRLCLNGPYEIPTIPTASPDRDTLRRADVQPDVYPDTRKEVGCGTKFIWRDLPKIPDEKIMELFQVDSVEKAREFCNRSDFVAARNRYESNIDRTFYS